MVDESDSEAYGKDLPRNPDDRQVEIIVDSDNFAANTSKLMYYGTYQNFIFAVYHRHMPLRIKQKF